MSRTVLGNQINILPMRDAWPTNDDGFGGRIVDTVDWTDRHLVLRIMGELHSEDLHLDLLGFECVARAADGYVAESFYAHDLRRIRNFLGRLAERAKRNGELIQLFMDGTEYSVSVDDGMIQVSGGAQ